MNSSSENICADAVQRLEYLLSKHYPKEFARYRQYTRPFEVCGEDRADTLLDVAVLLASVRGQMICKIRGNSGYIPEQFAAALESPESQKCRRLLLQLVKKGKSSDNQFDDASPPSLTSASVSVMARASASKTSLSRGVARS